MLTGEWVSPARPRPPLVIGLDAGTTGCRAVVFDRTGAIVGEAAEEYPMSIPHPGWAEQDPETIYRAVLASLQRAINSARIHPRNVSAIGLSSVLHSLIPIGEDGQALAPALIWADTRSAPQARRIRAKHDAQALYRRTGCPVHPMYPLAKLVWLQENAPDIWHRSTRFVSIKEYLIYRLCGEYLLDLSIASGTGLLNLALRDWDDEALRIAGVERECLSPIVEPTTILPPLRPEAATEAGLLTGTPVVAGAADGVLSSLGIGTLGPGEMSAMIGTSGACRIVSDSPRTDPQARTWCYYLAQGKWVIGGAINNAGLAYRWVRDSFFDDGARGEDGYTRLNQLAADTNAGADGLIFLPFLTGERAPYWNVDARGVLLGLNLRHTRRHLARAAMEGVCYRMYSVYRAIDEVAGPVTEVRATGGFTRSDLWVQIMADVFGQPLLVPAVREASSLGAAVLAWIALGELKQLDEAKSLVQIRSIFEPQPDRNKKYARLFDLYMKAYWALQEVFQEIAEVQREWG